MRKSIAIIIIVFCLVLVVALLSIGVILLVHGVTSPASGNWLDWWRDWRSQGGGFPWSNLQNFEINEDRSLSLDGVEAIEIRVLAENLKITAGQQDIKASLTGTYRSRQALRWDIRREGNKAVLAIEYPMMGYLSSQLALNVAIPAGFAGSVTIQDTSGACEIPDNADYAWRSLTINSVSGDVTLGAATMDNLTIKTVSGRIKVGKASGTLQLESVSGKVAVTYTQVKATQIKTISGDISLKLPAVASCQLTYETVSGDFSDVDLNWSLVNKINQKTIVRLGDGEQAIAVSTVSGDLETEARNDSASQNQTWWIWPGHVFSRG